MILLTHRRWSIGLTRLAAGIAIALSGAAFTQAESWPTYRHDVARSGISSETPTLPLESKWHYRAAQPPSPAWPPPHFIMLNRLDFDYAPQPVAAEGIVCFGSSTDDTVRAVDLTSGELRWQFTTGGPVRLPPQIADARVYFGSDDGCAYCVTADTGALVWKFRAAPQAEQHLGNGRMISRWPIRTGVLVDDDVAYLAAGMWASEGVYAYALDAKTGSVRWCNDQCGYAGIDYNKLMTSENVDQMVHGVHDGDFGVYGLTPQGSMAATKETLLIPNGYNSPAGLDRKTGRLLFAEPNAGTGGSWLVADGDSYHAIYRHRNNKIVVAKRHATTNLRTSAQFREIYNLVTVPEKKPTGDAHHEEGKTSILMRGGKAISRNAYGIALAGKTLFLGREGYVAAFDLDTNTETWRGPIDGRGYEIAFADGRLIVGTDRGTVHCFAPASMRVATAMRPSSSPPIAPPVGTNVAKTAPKPAKAASSSAPPTNPDAKLLAAVRRLQSLGVDRGYALVLGDPQGKLAELLVAQTDLKPVVALQKETEVRVLRERLIRTTTQYGSRIHVIAIGSEGPESHGRSAPAPPVAGTSLPFAQYFANAILVAGPTPIDAAELFRVLRPCGGTLLFVDQGEQELKRVVQAVASETAQKEAISQVADQDGLPIITRGQLPGAVDWNTDLAVDQRARWPLRPLWFGGPSSAQVTDDKSGNARAQAAYGRYFVLGEDSLSAVDAYNGTILWTRPLPEYSPDLQKFDGVLYPTQFVWSREFAVEQIRRLAVNDQHVFLTMGSSAFRGQGLGCIVLDARTGRQQKIYAAYTPPPTETLGTSLSWPLIVDETHRGSVTLTRSPEGIAVRLESTDPQVTRRDRWELFFDLRSPDERFGLYERGVFQLMVMPPIDDKTAATWSLGTGAEHPQAHVQGRRTTTGTEATLSLSWDELKRVAMGDVDSFGFAATLSAHDDGPNELNRTTAGS